MSMSVGAGMRADGTAEEVMGEFMPDGDVEMRTLF